MSAAATLAAGALARLGEGDAAQTGVGLVVFGVLGLLLLLRELARVSRSAERARRAETLRFAILPLVSLFVAIVAGRGADLLT